MSSNMYNPFTSPSTSTTSSFSSNPLAKEAELQAFESSFFPAGGAPLSSNIPKAPVPPTRLGNTRTKPINLKTRNWGPKLENGFSGLNRSLYDRPNAFSWESKPVLDNRSNSSSVSSTSSSSSFSPSSSIPTAPPAPRWNQLRGNALGGRRLRLRDWGHPTKHRWSKMNKSLYPGLQLERNVIMNELWAKHHPMNRGFEQNRGLEQNVMMNPLAENFMPVVQQNIMPVVEQSVLTSTVATVPSLTTVSAPVDVRATTVPVPMLNPPINDGRRYAKLYSANTAAMNGTGKRSLVKRRGTRRDHLVQPSTPLSALPITTSPSTFPLSNGLATPPLGTVMPMYSSGLPTATGLPAAGLTKKEQRAIKKNNKQIARNNRKLYKTRGGAVNPLIPGTSSIIAPAPLMTTAAPIMSTPAPIMSTISPMATTAPLMSTTPILGGVPTTGLAQPGLLAGTTTGQPVKRARRARKAKKGTEQPVFSNIISATQGAPTTIVTPTTTILPVESTFVKQEFVTPMVQPLAVGNPIM